jgi:glycosyltransferase involved in cell wall biosynthesis
LYEKELNADILNEDYLAKSPKWRRWVYRLIPPQVGILLEGLIVKRKYDAVVSWPEQLGIPFGILLRVFRSHIPHISLIFWISTPKKARLLKMAYSHIDKLLSAATSQSEFMVKEIGIPRSKVVDLGMYVDQMFWRPMNVPTDMISSSGREYRDYGALIAAVKDLNIRCHIGATTMVGKKDRWIADVERAKPLPPHITVGFNEKISEIRAWYARSKFVVLPLFPSLQAIGSTVILEAMAMEKAVICSRVEGQRDIIIEGKTGIFVPPEDARALREAIQYLWDNPKIAEEMGKEGRKRVEKYFMLDEWVARIKSSVEEVIATKS